MRACACVCVIELCDHGLADDDLQPEAGDNDGEPEQDGRVAQEFRVR